MKSKPKPSTNKFLSLRTARVLLVFALFLSTAPPALAASDTAADVLGPGSSAIVLGQGASTNVLVQSSSTDAGKLGEIIITIAKWVLDILVVVAFALMAVGVATGFVTGQLLTTLGAPHGVSTAMMRVIAVIGCGVGAFLTVTIINAVLELVGGFAISNDLQMPGAGGDGGTGSTLDGVCTALAWARFRFLPF